MRTAIIIDVDNVNEREIEVIYSLYTRNTHFYAVGLAPADLVYSKKNSALHCNKNKFRNLANKFEFASHQLSIIANPHCLADSSDILISKLIGREIIGNYDQALVVSNDNSVFMSSVVLKQLMPTWIVKTRRGNESTMNANRRVMGVPVIQFKHTNYQSPTTKFIKEI